jgi:biotin carboxyl carrier protein
MKRSFRVNGAEVTLTFEKNEGEYTVQLDGKSYQVSAVEMEEGVLRFNLDGKPQRAHWAVEDAYKRWLALDGRSYLIEQARGPAHLLSGEGAGNGEHLAPMPGQVREVLVAVGDSVKAGQTLLLLEAMKMEMRIQAALPGVVQKLVVHAGQQVNKDDVLVVVVPREAE